MDADAVWILLDPGDSALIDADQTAELRLGQATGLAKGAQVIGQLCRSLQR
jgi:hypothetical protein